MKKILNKKLILIILLGIILLTISNKVYGISIKSEDYTEEYKQWLNLSDEEKSKTIMPAMYNIPNTITNSQYLKQIKNLSKFINLVGSSLETKYNLKDIIPENTTIKDQKQTNSCWSFASIGALESTLALSDSKNSKKATVYDYAERHMVYATTRAAFLNDAINKYGYNKKVSDGGNFYLATNYLTNGFGAINESDMPFENNENNINISEIQNKTVQTTVTDSVIFELNSSNKAEIQTQTKEFIKNYGGVTANIYFPSDFSNSGNEGYYNNSTGALFCNNSNKKVNHEILIIGWDDNYSKDNFNTSNKPTNNGAWIIKNSYGTEITTSLSKIKQNAYSKDTQTYNQNGINSADEIPNDLVIKAVEKEYGEGKVNINGDTVYVTIGDNGYMYISYEDVNVLTDNGGIQKATNTKIYDKVYMNDELGPSNVVTTSNAEDALYIANVFKRDKININEALSMISIYTPQTYKCQVFVNPDGNDLTKITEAKLEEGNTQTIETGYHIIKLAEPIILTSDTYAIVVKVSSPLNVASQIMAFEESKKSSTFWENAEINEGESFISNNGKDWQDLSKISQDDEKGNLCLRGYTNLLTIASISVNKLPNKTSYILNTDKLDLTGGEIKVTYTNGETKVISMTNENIKITGFDNTKIGDETLTVSYENKTTTFQVTIDKESEKDTKKPVSSNFDNITGKITAAKGYIYKNKNGTNYCVYTIEINGIKIGDRDDTYIYKYYLSGKKGEDNITSWITINNNDITQNNDGTMNIKINVNTKDLGNESELENSNDIFIYIQETATINGTTIESKAVTNDPLQVSCEPEIYIDDVKQGTKSEVTETVVNTEKNKTDGSDTTTATTSIPQTGVTPIIIISILILLIGGTIAIVKYRNIDK